MKTAARTVITFFVLLFFASSGHAEPLLLQWSTVQLNTEDDQVNRIGAIQFQGGLNLTSRDSRFGGVSGLAISADGYRLSAVTDKGNWIQFTPVLDPHGRLTGIDDANIGALRNPDGSLFRKKRDSDAESLTRITGGFAVSFEHRHRLWLYRGGSNPFEARPVNIALPAISRGIGANKGIETLASLADGRLVAIGEDFPAEAPFLQGWIFQGNQWHGFRYRRHALFLPTGAAPLPNDELVILERRFTFMGGFASRLAVLSAKSIRPGVTVRGEELLRLERPFLTENFEGVAAHRAASGKTVLYLISDDNFLPLQRTLLLKFSLAR